MTDATRIDRDDADALERRLASSWKTDGPSPAAKAATLAMFAAGAGAGAALAAGAKGGAVTAKVAAAAGWSFAAKVGVGVLAVAAAGSVATFVATVATTPASRVPVAVSAAAPVEAAPIAARTNASASSDTTRDPAPGVAPVAVTSLPSVVVAVPSVATAAPVTSSTITNPTPTPVVSAAAAARPDVALEEQVRAIDGARAALDRGDAAGCLAALARYDQAFPNGMLSQEASLLRVQALMKRGDRAGARDVAERFLASHASSPHEQKMRRLLETNP